MGFSYDKPKIVDSILSCIIASGWNYLIWFVFFYHMMSEGVQNAMNDMFYFLIPYFIFLVLHFWKLPRIPILLLGIAGCVGFCIWLGIFFGCFYNNLKREYKPASNCIIQYSYTEEEMPYSKLKIK